MLTKTGVDREIHQDYRPTLFVGDASGGLYGRTGGPDPTLPPREGLSESLVSLRAFLDGQAAVADLSIESHRETFPTSPRPLL
jgi:DNA polymerase I